MDLFSMMKPTSTPLADRMRPRTLEEFFGQEHIVGKGRLLRRAIETDKLGSCIFFGPPGTGKTTLAQIIANSTHSYFEMLNAVSAGVKEVREIISRAEERQKLEGRSTYLLLDECHRWSKAQTDAILPAVEKGSIKFIGSTTENPLVAMTPAIVSRCRLFKFESLSKDNVREIILRAVKDKERGYGNMDVKITDEALEHIVSASGADARAALNALELAVLTTNPDSDGKIEITLEVAEESLQQKAMGVGDDEFYDMLSAFCKSLRGSDSDAALFWFARMILAGVDPMVIVRRIIAHASEDVGIADPNAMVQATAAYTALNAIGMPEARLSIAQAIIYVCEAPKSNSVCMAIDAAMREAKETYRTEVPLHLRDTHYAGSGRLGSGSGYKYPHNYEGHYVNQQYLPDGVQGGYYTPSEQGDEAEVGKRKEKRR